MADAGVTAGPATVLVTPRISKALESESGTDFRSVPLPKRPVRYSTTRNSKTSYLLLVGILSHEVAYVKSGIFRQNE